MCDTRIRKAYVKLEQQLCPYASQVAPLDVPPQVLIGTKCNSVPTSNSNLTHDNKHVGSTQTVLVWFITHSRKQCEDECCSRITCRHNVGQPCDPVQLYRNGCIRVDTDRLCTDFQGPAYSQCCKWRVVSGWSLSLCVLPSCGCRQETA